MNRYHVTQILSFISVFSAVVWWYMFPDNMLYADDVVGYMLMVLQLAIIPNAFLSLLTAVILLRAEQLKLMAGCFVRSVLLLWGIAVITLLALWFAISSGVGKPFMLPTFSVEGASVALAVPFVMLSAVILGVIIAKNERLKRFVPCIQNIQKQVSIVFEYIFLLIPVLVFFVIIKFLGFAGFDHSSMAIGYFMLALLFVAVVNAVIFPFLYRHFLSVTLKEYLDLIMPVALMTFLAGDSIAAIPLIARASRHHGQEEQVQVSRIITMVVICFPWVGELGNLIFPVYSATLESFGLSSILSILSVGPFFMFTDPYVSVPALMKTFNFPEVYRVTYMTLALLTDHMFEVCESIAVLFVVLRLKTVLFDSKDIKKTA
ncbi:cation:dicarboxylate symporter family transporter [Candidatus Synchoanobacter obligatus]|uniref:Cation:dicarboxylase symporter family transporter n=1 Tax=Candidatus Synchoanobacter obligatus TaxID=2919597 RepID=A0ABT1L3L3_9GAMM|nr:cation:dicarboxylase symporter family transporter [Candidatus Synchoanobacter obligatus]